MFINKQTAALDNFHTVNSTLLWATKEANTAWAKLPTVVSYLEVVNFL